MLSKKHFTTKASVKTLLKEEILPLLKNNSLKAKHERFFKKLLKKKANYVHKIRLKIYKKLTRNLLQKPTVKSFYRRE